MGGWWMGRLGRPGTSAQRSIAYSPGAGRRIIHPLPHIIIQPSNPETTLQNVRTRSSKISTLGARTFGMLLLLLVVWRCCL